MQADLAREQQEAAALRRLGEAVLSLVMCGETRAERAAVLLDSAKSYERAVAHLRALESGLKRELYHMGLCVRLEAHERGWINANETKDKT